MADLGGQVAPKKREYLCGNCGFKARQFFWQCPACGGWETFAPRRTAELDSPGRHLARMQIGQ